MYKIDKLVFASKNRGKIKEIQAVLKEYVHEIILQTELNIPDVPETGKTFIENAIIKARNACNYTNLMTFGDDSGLIIDALHGEPGIYSARYAKDQSDFNNNINKVLEKLKNVEPDKRTARFYSVFALLEHKDDPVPKIFQGWWEGKILTTPNGTNGFGYDPIFFVPTHNCSAACLDLETKNKISSRGQALSKLIKYLQSLKDLNNTKL